MKIKSTKNKLISVISKAEKIIGKNLSLPVLECLLLSAKDNLLTIRATNLDLGIEIILPVKVEKDGMVAIPGNILSNLLTNLSSDDVEFEVIGNNLSIKTENSSTLIKTFLFDDFPTIPRLQDEKFFTINNQKLTKGLKSVWYSASVSAVKPELSSILINQDKDGIVFAATDSFRLAESRVLLEHIDDFGQLLIPYKNIPEILRLLEDDDGEVKIYFTKNQIAIEYKDIYLTSRVIDGIFPDYKQIIPKEYTTEVIILKEDLINTLKIINVFSDKFNQVNFKIDPEKKVFQIKTKNNDIGENTNQLTATLTGDPLEINFNYKYIIDCMQSIDSDSISMQFSGLNKPIIIKGVPSNLFTYLVMPMNK